MKHRPGEPPGEPPSAPVSAPVGVHSPSAHSKIVIPPEVAATAKQLGLCGCHACGRVATIAGGSSIGACPRCGTRLHSRKPHSCLRAWIYLVVATILFFPANLLPVMTVESLGRAQTQTIVSGIGHLFRDGQWGLAAIVFVASVLVPLLKLAGLGLLLGSIGSGWRWSPKARTRLYRLIERVGRWSMLDIFVVALLVALVRFDAMASIRPGAGATAFAAVVVLTMLATLAFDPRLLWDPLEHSHD